MSRKRKLKELPLKESIPKHVKLVIAPLAGELVNLGLEINELSS